MIRPSRQPCSLLTGDDSLAPAATACRMIRSGSSTTSSVRLVAPSIARGLGRFMAADVAATQNAAPPTPSCATTSSPRRHGEERLRRMPLRRTRPLHPESRPTARAGYSSSRLPSLDHLLTIIFVQRGGQPANLL